MRQEKERDLCVCVCVRMERERMKERKRKRESARESEREQTIIEVEAVGCHTSRDPLRRCDRDPPQLRHPHLDSIRLELGVEDMARGNYAQTLNQV